MYIFGYDKLRLSNAAMKVAANNVRSGKTATESIMAALRHDNPHPYHISNAPKGDGRTEVCSDIVWVFGSCGSGKSELIFTAGVDLALAGYRSLHICGRGYPGRPWHPDESAVIRIRLPDETPIEGDVVAMTEGWEEQLSERLSSLLDNPSMLHITIITPPWMKLSVQSNGIIMRGLTSCLLAGLPADMALLIEEVRLRDEDLPDLERLFQDVPFAMIASDGGWTQPRLMASIRPHHAKILMRLVGDREYLSNSVPEFSEAVAARCQSFMEGDALLVEGGQILPVMSRYISCQDPVPVFGTHLAGRVIRRLSEALAEGMPLTHSARLEMVARACGYRSWHAAEGRGRG